MLTGIVGIFKSSPGTIEDNGQRQVLLDSNGNLKVADAASASTAAAMAGDYETVDASATDQALGASGAAGDRLERLVIIPATTSPGAVSIKDGAGSAVTVFTGGASSVADLAPIAVPVGAVSAAGAWSVTTGADVSVIAVGSFSA